jgi:hypothetical protein
MTTPEDIQSEDFKKANAEVEQILGATKPKHLGQGLTSGIGYILRGAVGACGAVVVCPTRSFDVVVPYGGSFSLSPSPCLAFLIKIVSFFLHPPLPILL